jgi:hypothetical protein
MRAMTILFAAVTVALGAIPAAAPAWAQAVAPGASVECDPVGVGHYRSGIVKEALPGGQAYKVDLDDYTPNGDLVACPANRLRPVPRDAVLKGPPAAYGVFHSGDRIECGTAANGVPAPGKVVGLVDPRGVYAVLFDGTEPGGKPRTCEGGAMKRFSGLPVGGMGFRK